jgi:DNA-binding transcriptional ArsR family regulator
MRRAPAATPALLDLVFAALADATRRDLFSRMQEGEMTVSALAEPLAMSLPAVSKHLRVLENAGLVQRRVEGRTHFLSANPQPLRAAVNWIEHQRTFWEASFQRLAALVEEPAPSDSSSSKDTPPSPSSLSPTP